MRELLDGFTTFFQGIGLFYRTPKVWPAALMPLLVVLVLYGISGWLLWSCLFPWLNGLLPENPEECASWWRWCIVLLPYLLGVLLFLGHVLLMGLLLGTLYEIVGELFFDRITEILARNYESEANAPKIALARKILFIAQSIRYALMTFLLGVVWWILGACIPVTGPAIGIWILGRRLGISYLFSSATASGYAPQDLRKAVQAEKLRITGFGIAGYLALMIPLLAIFILPALVAGGVILYEERVKRHLPPLTPHASHDALSTLPAEPQQPDR